MKDDIKLLISTPFEEIISTSMVLKLLNVFSKLYLNGAQPGGCSLCLRDYFKQINQNGMELAEKYELAKNRVCIPAWKGIKYIPATARHWSSELLNDDEATKLLSEGNLKESDFEVLPKANEPKNNSEESITKEVKKRGPKRRY